MKQWTVARHEGCWCKVAPWSVTHIMSHFPLIPITSSFIGIEMSDSFCSVNACFITCIFQPNLIGICTNLYCLNMSKGLQILL